MASKTRSRSQAVLARSNNSLRRVGAGVVLAPLKASDARESKAQRRTAAWREWAGHPQPREESGCESAQDSRMAVGSGALAARSLRKSMSLYLHPTNDLNNRTGAIQQKRQVQRPSANIDPADLEPCSICLDALACGRSLGVCLDANGSRSCQHYFHIDCLRHVEGARCPQCRTRFHNRTPLPGILEDGSSWCKLVSVSGQGDVSKHDMAEALKAMLRLRPDDVDALVKSYWDDWSRREEHLNPRFMQEVIANISEYLPDAMSKGGVSSSAWEDDEKLEDGHTRSGVVCSCGQIHVRRGDRVRRGPMPLGTDEMVIPGQLGTIVRIGEGQESVVVKWDRCPGEKVHSYTWPDPDRNVLAPASFKEVADDVLELQKQTGLSSAAAERFLREGTCSGSSFSLEEVSEKGLRKQPQLFHRARILPDKLLVQQWYDNISPCQCKAPNCRGGVQWSSRADKHLGREAMILQMDADDDTVLVETQGPCNCQIWYPTLAVEPVYDPDLADKPSFKEEDHVECRMREGWEKGVVQEVLWHGSNRKGPAPYAVLLDNGRKILVPHVSLIRKAPDS